MRFAGLFFQVGVASVAADPTDTAERVPAFRVIHSAWSPSVYSSRCPSLVYQRAHLGAGKKSLEVAVRPRQGSTAGCWRCDLPAPGYGQLAGRRFVFIPLWGVLVSLLYTMWRVDCRRPGVVAVEETPARAGIDPPILPTNQKFVRQLQFSFLFLALEGVAGIAARFEEGGAARRCSARRTALRRISAFGDVVPAGQKTTRRRLRR